MVPAVMELSLGDVWGNHESALGIGKRPPMSWSLGVLLLCFLPEHLASPGRVGLAGPQDSTSQRALGHIADGCPRTTAH